MTNPNNAIGTNGAFDGRTSPNALNDIASAFTSGIVSGWTCAPKTGMTVQLGGSASVRDVAIAEDNANNKLTINNRSGAPVEVTLDGAPATNNRVDAIVAYVDNPSTGDGTTTDNPSACGIIAVKGTVAANPSAPTEAQIRAAITTDGATGGIAYYVVLATILVGTNVTTIGAGVITQGGAAQSLASIADGSVTTPKIADDAVTGPKIDWSTIRTTLFSNTSGTSPSSVVLSSSIANFDAVEIYFKSTIDGGTQVGFTRAEADTGFSNISLMSCKYVGGGSPKAYLNMTNVSISGTAVSHSGAMAWNSTWGTSNISATNQSDIIKITKVVGIKYA
jgi:hypothetical protein